MINMHTKSEVSTDMKGNTNVEIGVVWEVRSHSKLPATSPFDRAHTTSYLTLTEIMHLSCTIFEL